MEKYADITLTTEDLKSFYKEYFSYYKTLNTEWQSVFISRCLRFVSDKLITGAAGFTPDNKVKAIIAASAVQLTLGLEHWKLDYFDTIIIHPGDFENKPSGLKFRGETNLEGYIKLSWQSFISGYKVADDNINLGLHEFTHALRFNPFRGAQQDYFVEHYFNRWLAGATEAYNDIRNKKSTIFRKYGGANINEFMSVCIEHFFESPQEIKEKYPLLYYSTAILLNQETLNNVTYVNIRKRLLEDYNKLCIPVTSFHLKTDLKRTSSFIMMIVTAVPMLYTMIETGINSGVSLFLAGLSGLLYLRFDFNFISVKFEQNVAEITKGFLIFRKRSKANFQLAQLISVRVEESLGVSDWEIVYYNLKDSSFYSELIKTNVSADKMFLRQMWMNKVAIFKS